MTRLVLSRAQLCRRGDERGFALLYVLMITSIVAVLVASALVVTSSQIIPSVHTAYVQAADAAAQSGLQDFVAYLDDANNCQNLDVTACATKLGIDGTHALNSGTKTVVSEGSYSGTFQWSAKAYLPADTTKQYIRVQSTGQVQQNGQRATKVVVGDIVPGATLNDLDYGIVTGFETQSSASVLADWPQRSIALSPAAIAAAGVPVKGGGITWSGTSPGKAAGKVAVCNSTFNDPVTGRSVNPPAGAPNPYVDYAESGLAGNNYTDYEPCHTSWGNKTQLIAPVDPTGGAGGYFSRDALLISNSYPGGSGPLFNQPVTTSWQYTSMDGSVCSAVSGQNYLSFNLVCAGYPVEVGGTPSSASTYPNVQWRTQGPQLPAVVNYAAVAAANTCVYAGPTRALLHADNTATITSPETTSTWASVEEAAGYPAQCYGGAAAQGTGMAQQTVNLAGITVLRVADNGNVPTATPGVAHGSTGWPTTGQVIGDTPGTTNSVFDVSGATSAASAADAPYTPQVGDTPKNHSDGAWTPQWSSYSSGSTCDALTSVTDLKFFNCYQGAVSGTYDASAYSKLKAKVQAALSSAPASYNTASSLQSYLNNTVLAGGSTDTCSSSTPANGDYQSHRWCASVVQDSSATDGCTPGTTTGTTPDSVDPLFTDTGTTTRTCLTATVTLQVGESIVGLGKTWGDGGILDTLLSSGHKINQFTLTTSNDAGPVTRSFPSMSDVTQYQMGFDNTGAKGNDTFGANGPGDLYVEGEMGHTMALVGDDDVIITGSTGPAGTTPAHPSATNPNPDAGPNSATSALEIVGRNDVRIYHPVQCYNSFGLAASTFTSEIANTDPGFCPNDITGLFDSVPSDNARPNNQYANMRSDLAGLTVHAAVFALGNSTQHETCPSDQTADQYTNGNGNGPWCGGEFSVDNYGRGTALGYLTAIGTLGMAHHAAVGEEWHIKDAAPTTSPYTRVYSGYQMAQQYQNLKALLKAGGLSGLLDTTSLTSGLWHITSISTGATP